MGHELAWLSPVGVAEQRHRLVVFWGEVEGERGPYPLFGPLYAVPTHVPLGIQPSDFHNRRRFRRTEVKLDLGPLARLPADSAARPPFGNALSRCDRVVDGFEWGRNDDTVSDVWHVMLLLSRWQI